MNSRPDSHRLRARIVAISVAAMMAAGSLVLASPATALSKHVFSTSFAGSGATALSNPSDVAVDQSTGDVYVSDTPEDNRQSLEVDATGGTFKLTFKGQTTSGLAFNAPPSKGSGEFTLPGSVEEALEKLSTVGPNNVQVYEAEKHYVVIFKNELADSEQPQLVVDSFLIGGGTTVHVRTLLPGGDDSDVEKYAPSGQLIWIAGRGVDKTKFEAPGSTEAEQNLCAAASGDVCQHGTQGSSPGAFNGFYEGIQNSTIPFSNVFNFTDDHHLYLALDQVSGDLYVGDPNDATVTKLGPEGDVVTDWGEGGQLNGSSAGTKGPFHDRDDLVNGMAGIGVRPDRTLLVRAKGEVFRFAPDGTFLGTEYERTAPDGIETFGDAITPETRERYHIERRFIEEPMVVEHFPPSVTIVDRPGEEHVASGPPFETFGKGELVVPQALVLDPLTGTVYVADSGNRRIAEYSAVPYLPDAIPAASAVTPESEKLEGEVERAGAGEVTGCHFEYGTTTAYGSGPLPCTTNPPSSLPYSAASVAVSAVASGLEYATTYHFHLVAENSNGENASFDESFTTLPQPPLIESVTGQAFAESTLIRTSINPGGAQTTFRVEYATQQAFEAEGFEHAQSTGELDANSTRTPQQLVAHLNHLTPATTYHYRVIATNASSPAGGTIGPEHSFSTLPFVSEPPEPCANGHVRQQTSAAQLLDCRAYELVSAADAAGYDVESNTIAGQEPFAGYPQANGRVLYGVHSGGIPGTNHPTNRGLDPYVASRGQEGWYTEYVGVPANEPFSAAPYSSTPTGADANLDTFAFGGPGGCSPCFPGGYTGIPVREPDGDLEQGMTGSESPGPSAKSDGFVAKDLSANGQHLIFASTSRFSLGGNDGTGDVSIYDRDLKTGQTHVVSNLPGSEDFPAALPCLQGAGKCSSEEGDANGISELDVSSDGSRILLGQKVSEDAHGNPYWHLYMEVDDSVDSIDLTPGVISEPGGPGFGEGVLYDGMTSDGSKVFFTTKDTFSNEDKDTSADVYRADVSESGATLRSLSSGSGGAGEPGNTDSCEPAADTVNERWNAIGAEEDCGAVAVGGGGGVASVQGAVYFLSPEKLDGSSNGVENAPNLYVAEPGSAPRFVRTLESSATAPLPPGERPFKRTFGHFETPVGVAVSEVPGEKGDTYVLDLTNEEAQGNVRKFDPSGELITSFGTGGKINGSSKESPAFEEFSPFELPTGMAVDNDPTSASYGDIYVPNIFEEVVEKYSPSGAYLGSLSVGLPTGVAVDQASGEVFATELFGGVHVFDDQGKELRSFATISEPTGVAVARDGTTYVVNGGGLGGGGETEAYNAAGSPIRGLSVKKSLGVAVDPETEDVYVDEGGQVVEFDPSGSRVGASTGNGRLTDSIGLAAYAGELYVSNRGAGPATGEVDVFGTPVLPPDRAVDNQLVIDSVNAPETRHTNDFQINPSGADAVFPSSRALAGQGEEPNGHILLFRYDSASEELACVSCTLSGFPSVGDSSLAADGLSITDDGRVFFNSNDPLLASDTDEKTDVYEWEPAGTGNCEASSPTFDRGVCLGLVSAGTSSFDSGLLSATSNATDAYFFTRDSLAPQDENGPTMKIYDARANGGFPFLFPAVTCRASDECHGAASPAPGPLKVGSATVTPPAGSTECKKHFVLKRGRCVKKPKHDRHRKRAKHHGRGGK